MMPPIYVARGDMPAVDEEIRSCDNFVNLEIRRLCLSPCGPVSLFIFLMQYHIR
jgi:hypothetical protein